MAGNVRNSHPLPRRENMTDAEREAQIRQNAGHPDGFPFLEREYVLFLLLLLDKARAELAEQVTLQAGLQRAWGEEREKVGHLKAEIEHLQAPPGDPTIERQPREAALRFAHDGRWPDNRVDLARLCEEYAAKAIREAVERERERIYKAAEIRWLRGGLMEAVRALLIPD